MIPYRLEPTVAQGVGRTLMEAIPRSYAIVFYSTDTRFGWALLALSLLIPWVGLAGLAAVVAAALLARLAGVDPGWIRDGFAEFNAMLSTSGVVMAGLANGWTPGVIVALWAAAVVLSLALTVGLQGWIGNRLGLSVQSLPAVIVVILLHWCGHNSVGRVPVSLFADWLSVDLAAMPEVARAFFRAFSAMTFHTGELAGLLCFIALGLISPLGALMALAGFAAGAGAMAALGWPVTPESTAWCGFNFLLAGMALGAGYQIPNRASLALAICGAALTAVVALALGLAMGWLQLSPGALPYNLAVFILMAGVRWLPQPRGLVRSPWSTLPPEEGARHAQINARRFPDFFKPALFLPWTGTRVVTQGFQGELTHRGEWSHALDLEAPGGTGSWDAGTGDLREFAVFGTEVFSPVGGTVIAIENQIPDNPAAHNNPEHNWGNHVILRADAGFHVMLAHFQKDTVAVTRYQRVEPGTLLGRCGNSGRSPVPHLHLHAQSGPARGAPTIPFVLKHFITPDPGTGRERYHLSGIPRHGALLRPAKPSDELYAAFSGWMPGTQVWTDAAGGEITLVLDFDETGKFRLESARTGDRLTLFLSEGVLYASPFSGKCPLLSLLGILLARVPCMDEPAVFWTDHVASAPFQNRARRIVHDVCDPFIGVEMLTYEYALPPHGGGVHEIIARLVSGCPSDKARTPRRLRGRLQGRLGPVEISGETFAGKPLRWKRKEQADEAS